MLTVIPAAFFENFAPRPDGSQIFTGRYDKLYFDEYPVTTDVSTLAIEFHAVGEFEGYYLIRVRLGEQTIHETALSAIHLRGPSGGGAGASGNFGITANLQGITFPSPGLYRFEIIFNDSVLHSVPLTLIQTKKHKKRKRF